MRCWFQGSVSRRRESRKRSPVCCRQEKRPAGITPPAFSCNCRLGRSGSAAIPCLKLHHYSINKILRVGCEVHHGWAEPSDASFVPIRVARLQEANMTQVDFHCFNSREVRLDRSGEAGSDLAEARERAACI